MKKLIIFLGIFGLLIACGKEKSGNLIVNGSIDGLKKGTVYLQKVQDSILISVDSVQVNGIGDFVLVDNIDSPEVYYVTLDKKSDEKIAFFADEGEVQISSKLERLSVGATVTAGINQELWMEHDKMARQFSDKQLDFIKERFEAQQKNDTATIAKIDADESSLLRRKYLFTTNFAVNNAAHEVAPFLALTELVYANVTLLDTINNSLSEKVKTSKYGIQLNSFIEEIKKTEQQ